MITEITTGFLTGNLEPQDPQETERMDWDASLARYDELLEAAIKAEYPSASVTIRSQDGVGATPYSLETRAYDADGNEDRDAAEDVDILAGQVWQDWQWVVYK